MVESVLHLTSCESGPADSGSVGACFFILGTKALRNELNCGLRGSLAVSCSNSRCESAEPERMAEVLCTSHLKGDPTGIRNPAVLLSETLSQPGIPYRVRKWNVHDPARVDVSNFRLPKEEFPTPKAMWMY